MQQHFSAHLAQAHSNQKKNADANAGLRKTEREKDSLPWRTNLHIHLSQMELMGTEFEANEGSNSYIEAGSRYYQLRGPEIQKQIEIDKGQ